MTTHEDLEPQEDEEADDVEQVEPGVTETDDGGAIIDMEHEEGEQQEVEDVENFYDNIVDAIDSNALEALTTDLLNKIDIDKNSRQKRVDEYTDALKRTGLGDDSPGGAQFQGASKVIHPILIESTIDYASRSVAELMPPDGPVKMYIPGEPTKKRSQKAERKARHMNWQFRTQMKEFKTELEQIQTQEPLGGVAYLRLVFDGQKRRPVPTFIPLDDIYLPYACSSFYTAERMTWKETLTDLEFERRVKTGMYREPEAGDSVQTIGNKLTAPSQTPEISKAEEANQKIEGKEPDPVNIDGQRIVYLVQAIVELEEAQNRDEEPRPYLLSIDATSRKTVAVVRNWEEEDDAYETMPWIIEWPFIPWRGAYPIGLNQVMAGIPAAVTGALRALLDSAHINNLPSLVKLKGANVVGQTQTVNVGQMTEIEGGIGSGDIRQLLMAIPYNPPSATLFSLMGMLVETGKGVVRTALDNLAEYNNRLPATTAMALIEQGMKVMSAIHLRQWTAMDNTIQILHRINRLYLTDEEILDDTGSMLAYREDYEGPLDCIPTADPQVFSDAQRFAQIELIAGRAVNNPLYDQRKVEEAILERTRFPNAKELLVAENKPKPMNAVNENLALALGRPVAAFPEQDHLAHLQIILDFSKSPMFGQLPVIARTFIVGALDHIKEHLLYWYVSDAYDVANKAVKEAGGKELSELMSSKDPEDGKELDRLMAVATKDHTIPAASELFKEIPTILQQMQQLLASLMPPPMDPTAQTVLAVQKQKGQDDLQKALAVEGKKDAREAANRQSDTNDAALKENAAMQRTQLESDTKKQINKEDNLTALTIAGGEIAAGHRSELSTGTGENPGSNP
jgi:hypothetical protein